jgi:HD-like signal output (HDOD) protein
MAAPMPTNEVALRFREVIVRDLSRHDFECPTFIDASLGVRLALSDKDLSNADLARVVSAEPVLSVRVVALANGAWVRHGGKRVTDVKRAITRIGQHAVRNIAVALALQQMARAKDMLPFRAQAEQVWAHSLEVAVLGHVLSRCCTGINADEAQFAGLVHDLGHFYLMWRAVQIPELAARPGDVRGLVREWHPVVSGVLLNKMGLSETLIRAVNEHEFDAARLSSGSLSQVLALANHCALVPSLSSETTAVDLPSESSPRFGLDEPTARAVLAAHADEVTAMLAALKT